ncbi:hypothetical protein WN943_002496 [Citrus x changshan-huyou]
MFVEVEEQHAMKIDEIAWLKTAGTRSTVHVRLVAWLRQQQLVRASSAVPPRHRGLFICMVVEVLVDERRKIMKVGSHQVAIEENR